MIAALFVERKGSYARAEDVDVWDEKRDARLYEGPHAVVAHPPCARWCRLAGLVEARWGHAKGDDGGCFASALASVRRWGGVLEHPAWSDAWAAFDLNAPPFDGGWVNADFFGGWTCHVEQGRYGHAAKKATWLLAYRTPLPSLRWGGPPDRESSALVSWCGNRIANGCASATIATDDGRRRPRLTKRAASATPKAFRDVLIGMARSVPVEHQSKARTQAPAMARLLLAVRDGEECCECIPGPVPAGAYSYNTTAEHAPDCALIAVLRAAGVVE